MPWNVCWLSGKCLRGVWGLCEWLWIQGGGYDVQSIDKHQILLLYISGFLFSQLPWNGQNVPYFRVSAVCLEGVWEASGVVWVTLDTVWGDTMCKQLINTQFGSSSFAYSFSPSCLRLPYLAVSVGCLEGVWEVSGSCLTDFKCYLGGYGVDSFDKNQIWIILISCVIFSRWPFLSN